MLRIERIRGQEMPSILREDWNRLAGDVPFCQWEWLANWHRYYGAGDDLYLLLARDEEGRIRGIAPWRLCKSVSGGRVIAPLGNGKVCSDYIGLLCNEADEHCVASAIAEWLIEANSHSAARGDSWDLLHLDGVLETDSSIQSLVKALKLRGLVTHQKTGMCAWRVDLKTDWETYLASLSKVVRRQAKRALKTLAANPGVSYHEATDASSLEKGLAILADLHQKRWDRLGVHGCFSDDRFTHFLAAACRDFLAQGRTHLSWLELDGKPFVANIEFSGGPVDYVYQGGMDPDSRSLSPGWLHMIHLFRRSYSLGRTHRDYLRGDEPYKKHWRGKPTPLIDLRIVPPHATARLRHGVWMLGDSLKHWLKQRLRGGASLTGALPGSSSESLPEHAGDAEEATENTP